MVFFIVCTRSFDERKVFRSVLNFTDESDGYRSHEKYIPATIRDTLLTVGIWMLVSVEVGDSQKRVSHDVLNLPKFESWWGCSDLPSKITRDVHYWVLDTLLTQ